MLGEELLVKSNRLVEITDILVLEIVESKICA